MVLGVLQDRLDYLHQGILVLLLDINKVFVGYVMIVLTNFYLEWRP